MITFIIKDSKNLLLPIFITGLLSCWRTNLSYIYVQELFSSKFKSIAGTLFLVNDVMTMLYSTMFFQYVSTEWKHLMYIVLTIMAVSIFILFQMPESPSFLYETSKFFEAEAAYNVIARFNGKRPINVEIPADRSFISEDGTITILSFDEPSLGDKLRDSAFRTKMLLTILFWIGCEFCFFMIGFHMKYMPGNIFDIITLQAMVTCIAFTSGGVISKKIGTKQCIAMSFCMATFGSYLMIKVPGRLGLELPLLIFTKFGVDCGYSQVMAYTTSEFPAYLTSQVLGICNIFSSMAGILAPQIAEMDDPIPMWVCFGICLISLVGSIKPEIKSIPEEEDIDLDNSYSILKRVFEEKIIIESPKKDDFVKLY